MGAEIDRLEVDIEASASKANAELNKLLNRLDKISGSLSGIDTKKISGLADVFRNSTSQAGKGTTATKKLSNSFLQLSGRITRSQRSLKSFSQIAGNFYANTFLIIRGLKKLGSAIESSMDYVETYNYFSVTMDKIGSEFAGMYEQYGYDSAEAYANSFSGRLNELTRKMTGYSIGSNGELTMTDSIGLALDPQKIMDYQASIAAITNSVGLLGENSVNVGKALTMLAADMSSLKNVDLSTAMTNFQSGLIGQSRALYKYGIDITNNTLQTYAYSLGLNKAVSEMTQAEKMQLRMIAILDQSKVAWGDAANTINSVANQYRILKQQISNLARVIGNLFLPIVQKVLPVVNGLMIALQRLFSVLGFKIWGGNWLKDTMEGISGGGASDGVFDGLEEDADDYADSLSGADKAAKKLAATLLGFDEINKLSDTPDSATGSSGIGSGAGGIDLSDAIGAALAEYESVWDKAFANSKNKAQEYADAITDMFTRAWKAIEPFRNSVSRLWNEGLSLLAGYTFQNLKDFYTEFLKPIGMWSFGTEGAGLTRFVDVVNNQLMRIDWPWISDNLRKFWRAIEPYAEQFGEGLIDFFESISGVAVDVVNRIFGRDGAITSITDWLNSNDHEKARSWGNALGEFAVGLMALKGVGAILSGLSGIGTALQGLSSGLSALFGSGGMFSKIGDSVSRMFSDSGIFGSGGMIVKALEGISTLSGESVVAPIGVIAAAIVGLVAGIVELWNTSETFRDNVKNMLSIISDAFLEAKVKIWDDGLKPLWDSIKEFFDSLYQLYEDSGLKSIFEYVVTGIGYIVSEAFAALILGVADVVNTVAGFAQMAIGIFNKVLGNIRAFVDENRTLFEGVKKIFNGLNEFLAGAFSKDWERSWNGVKTIFSGVWESIGGLLRLLVNSMMSLFEGMANGVIDAWNSVKRAINSLRFTVPKWVPEIGGSSIGFNLDMSSRISLPRFENGGYPETGQLFLARENGLNEMIGRIGSRSAVANNDQIVEAVSSGVADAVADVMLAFMGNGSGAAPVIELTVIADSETIYRIALKGKEKHDRRYHAVAKI